MSKKVCIIFLLIGFLSVFKNNIYCKELHIMESGFRAKKVKFPFYIYHGYGAVDKLNFLPTGRMADEMTICLIGNWKKDPYVGYSCIKVVYDVSKPKFNERHWAGLFWLFPANNWGIVPNQGYDLRGAVKLVFHAKGDKGGEKISFTMGGVQGEFGDSGEAKEITVILTRKWKQYEIPLEKVDLKYIIGGFCWTANQINNPDGAVFYLDKIYYTDKED